VTVAVHVALLRGINLGGKRRVPMARLRELLTERGYEDVRTHLQSGNVVLRAPARAAGLEHDLATVIETEFGFPVPVVVRSRAQLDTVIAEDPFGDVVTEPKLYQITFLAGRPAAGTEARLQGIATGAERVAVRGREVYTWHPDGIGRSKLGTALGDRAMKAVATTRNFRTVLALAEMARE
jgi:uncharacterized protein (DUF1697 family)